MTISGTLANALSGLTAASRSAELVSSNVANAMTPGYGRREIMLAPRYLGGTASSGVNVLGVQREVDMGLVQDRRLADAASGHDSTLARFHKDLEGLLGLPGDASSLSGRLATLEAGFIEAASRPDSSARLGALLDAAKGVTEKLNAASRGVQALRMSADSEIAQQVKTLNDGLKRVESLNIEIREAAARGHDPSTLLDQRQQTIDTISAIVPLRQVDREKGMIALYTEGGAIVLDGRAVEIDFTGVGVIVPEMTQGSGALSGLSINGRELRTDGERSPIKGGSLAALFNLRDNLATQAQGRLDAVARDLVERFEASGLDTTRPPGAAGLFTDAGAPLSIADETGLAGRITVNAAVDPGKGGALWRLRDGLGASAPGNVGDGTLLIALKTALTEERVAASGDFLGVARSAGGLASEVLSLTSAERAKAEAGAAFSSARKSGLAEMEAASGVDTDYEMQKLMLIEQAYAANAKVVTTVSAMLDALMEL